MSPVASKLYRYLRGRPEGASLVMEELVEATHSSKTAVRAAMGELQSEGKLTYEQTS